MKLCVGVLAVLGCWLVTCQGHSTGNFPNVNPGHPSPINPGHPIPAIPIFPKTKPAEQVPYVPHDKCDAGGKCSCNCNYGVDQQYRGSGPNWSKPGKPKKDCEWEWKMVFKAVAGNSREVHYDFLYGGNMNEYVEEAQQIGSSLPYRDGSVLDTWNNGRIIKQVKVEVYDKGVREVYFLFNGIGSTIKSWMSQENLISSPYDDIKTVSLNYDSVDGHSSLRRRFFMNDNYGGCPNDCGYLAVVDQQTSTKPCDWEKQAPLPYFLYGNKKDTCSKYQTAGEAGIGDRFVISVKTCELYL